MTEMTPQDPETISEHFECFTDMYPDHHSRLEMAVVFANQLADEVRNGKTFRSPSVHQGYNLLLANWNSPEYRLRHAYELFRELSGAVESTAPYERIIICGGEDVDNLESVHERPQVDRMSGPFIFRTGRLAYDNIDFSYLSKLVKGDRGLGPVRSPCLIASTGVELIDVERLEYDFGRKKVLSAKESGRVSVIALGATIDNPGKYERENFAEASRVIVGDEACDEFFARLNDAYCIVDFDGPTQDHARVER